MTQHPPENEPLNVDLNVGLNVSQLPDKKLLELVEFYERRITTGRADFEEFNAFVLCQHERNRRQKDANRVDEA